jgi:cytidylate kinase
MPKYIEEMVSQQVRRSEIARRKQTEEGEPRSRPVVTISRRMGSGARIVAQKLATDLGWSLWAKELLDAIAEDADVSRQVVESFDEKTMSEIEVFARSALGDHALGGFLYPRHLARAVAAIARLGNAIILGRGANFLLPEALNVRIDASDEVRILNMTKFENLSRSEAESRIRESDKERAHFLKTVYGKERVQFCHYDLSICMDDFTADAAAEIIKAAIRVKYGVSV